MSKEFQQTGKFVQFLSFEAHPNHSHSRSQEEEKEQNYHKCIQLCQSLRHENHSLRHQVQVLSRRLNCETLYSPIKDIENQIELSKCSEGNVGFRQSGREEWMMEVREYKKQLLEEQKRKMREMRQAVDYLIKCYLEFTHNPTTQLDSILANLKNGSSMAKVVNIWKEYEQKEIIDFSGQSNLYHLECRQTQVLRKQLKSLSQVTNYLISEFRFTVDGLRAQIKGNSDKVCSEFKRCMKKYFSVENQKENQPQNSKNRSHLSSSKGSEESSCVKKWHPPLPSKTYSSTPKNCSTPKNNRSFSNMNNLKCTDAHSLKVKKGKGKCI